MTATTDGAPASQTTPSATQTDEENPPQEAGTETENRPLLGETTAAEVREARDFDVLKSIVYGGLVESIASLGVVSSAAGGGAATCKLSDFSFPAKILRRRFNILSCFCFRLS